MQGTYDAASKATLANEFDTENEDDVIKVILEKGELQSHEVSTDPTPYQPICLQ